MGHSRMAKRVAAQVPGYAYDEAQFFASDGAPGGVRRRDAERASKNSQPRSTRVTPGPSL